MADLATIERALRKADALAQQGDQQAASDAKRLADAYRAANQPAAQPETDGGSTLGAGIAGLAQSVSFGTAEEGKAAGWAAIDALRGKGSFSENYDKRLGETREDLKVRREAHPVAAYGGEIGGAFLLPGGVMKGGASLGGNALRMGAAGAAQGAAYGFGSGAAGAGERAKSAAVGGAVGGAMGAAVPYVLRGAQAIANSSATRKAIDAAADGAPDLAAVKAGSQAAYRAGREAGVVLDADAVKPLLDEIGQVQTLHKRFTPDANSLVSDIVGELEKGKVPLDAMEDLHRSAGMAVNKNRIGNPQDAAAAGEIGRKIDEFVMNLPDDAVASATGDTDAAVAAFRQGRRMWKSYRNSERLQEIVAKAELAENPANAIKNGFRAILNNKNKRATYSPAEIQVMRQVVSGTKSGGWVQRMIGYGTGLSRQVVGTAVGYGVGGPIGAALGSAAATKIGSMAKDAAAETAIRAADRAARFSAAGGQYAQPAPQLLPNFGNALRMGGQGATPAAVNLWNR